MKAGAERGQQAGADWAPGVRLMVGGMAAPLGREGRVGPGVARWVLLITGRVRGGSHAHALLGARGQAGSKHRLTGR